MSATAVISGPKTSRPGPRGPLLRLALRQYRLVALAVLLLALGVGAQILHHYDGWADAIALRDRVGSKDYHFGRYADDAHNMTARLVSDGARLVFQPALLAALITGVLTAREWETGRVTLALSQSVSPRRWFTVRWATLAVLVSVPVVVPVALYRISADHAYRLDLLTYGAERQNAYFTIGPVTVAYVLLGVAAGAATATVFRRTWPTLIAAPALTWLLVALLVRSRAVLLIDIPLISKVSGYHSGGVLGLQFYDLLPQDSFLLNSLDHGDYWPYQIASCALVLALATLLLLGALRVLRRRTA
ncbi:hypothetical protein ACWCQK_31940 [Streptomyces sp. NPDC002306]